MTSDPNKTYTPESFLAEVIDRHLASDLSDAEKVAMVRKTIAPLTHEQVGRDFPTVQSIIDAGAGTDTSWIDATGDSGELDFYDDGSHFVCGPSGESSEFGPYVITSWFEKKEADA